MPHDVPFQILYLLQITNPVLFQPIIIDKVFHAISCDFFDSTLGLSTQQWKNFLQQQVVRQSNSLGKEQPMQHCNISANLDAIQPTKFNKRYLSYTFNKKIFFQVKRNISRMRYRHDFVNIKEPIYKPTWKNNEKQTVLDSEQDNCHFPNAIPLYH